ncbi:MAG: hypothetical protein KDA63_19320, partial [Planctomycetales bacterium]|nr:hypothetical protein [Planctomycetales bacterium]
MLILLPAVAVDAAPARPTPAAPLLENGSTTAPAKLATPKHATATRALTQRATPQSASSKSRLIPGSAQRAQTTMLRWAPYRATQGTPGKLAKYGSDDSRRRENVAVRQPSFDDNGAASQPAVPSAKQPTNALPGPFDLSAPGDADTSPLPGPNDLSVPGGIDTGPSNFETSPLPGLDDSGDTNQGLGPGPSTFGDELAQGSLLELGPCPTIEDLDP